MAKMNLKRSIAMLLVLNMLTGMLPIQALAEDGNTEAPEITVTVSVSSESAPKSESKSEAAPAAEEKSETKSEAAPAAEEKSETVVTETASVETASYDGGDAEKIEHDTNLTLGENVDVTVSKETVTSTDEEGNTVEIETTEVTTSGTADNGDKVEGEETFVETTTTTENEIIVESVLEGEQETTTEEAPIAPGEEVPEVVAPIIPDAEDAEEGTVTETVEDEDGTVTETTTTIEKVTDEETGDESVKVTVNVTETSKETVGDEPESEDDTDFDFSEVVTIVDRTVTTEAEGTIEVTDQSSTDLDQIVVPEDYEGKHFDNGTLSSTNDPTGLLNNVILDYGYRTEKPDEIGYDYAVVGTAEGTYAAVPVAMDIVYVKDENGNPILDENGNYIIDLEKTKLSYAGYKAGNSGMDSSASIFAVKNEAGETYYAYCIDKVTEAGLGWWYKVSNLEDSDYYPDEESANMLRAIVTNGYWGTDATVYETDEEGNVLVDEEGNKIAKKDENGNTVVDETVVGSLAKIKALMKSTYDADAVVTVKDADGNEKTYKIHDIIDDLKEHEALAVTQAAIWSYSNGSLATQNGEDGQLVVGVQSAYKHYSSSGGALNQYSPVYDTESDARLKALYECLLGLDPISNDSEDVTTIVNEDNFVEDISLTIKDKVVDHESNEDDNADNDVYNTELNFTLAFVPDQKNDDLLVYLLDAEGNKINGADGKPIVKRLAGENSEGREADTITADENGVYTLTGLQLSEKSEFKFDLTLEGTQLLKDGVYVYTAHGGHEASQTLVGLAGGTQNVDVKASMSITFEVDESKTITATRKWRETTEETNPRENEETPPPPAEYRMGFGVGQLEVIEEEVPLAAPPQTGDMSILWFAMIAMSGCGLCILNLLEKRKCRA